MSACASRAAVPEVRRLAAVIVNYRTPELVLDCVTSLAPDCDPAQDLIVVVENGSEDDSLERLRSGLAMHRDAAVRLLVADHNGGLGAGINLAVREVKARGYLLLNSDTLVRRGAAARLLGVLQEDPTIGLVSPRLEWPDGTPQESCFRFPTPWSELINSSGTGPIRSLLARFDVPLPVGDRRCEPDWTSFAAVLVRAEVFERVGFVDEAFFMFFEDVDFCRRARRAGFRIVHEPAARIVHLRGGSSDVKALAGERKRLPRYYYRARSYYFRKTYCAMGLLATNVLWTAGHAIARIRERFGSKRPHAPEGALVDTWRA